MASPSSFINSSTAAAMHQSGACGATIGCRSLHSRFASRCVCFRIAIRAVSWPHNRPAWVSAAVVYWRREVPDASVRGTGSAPARVPLLSTARGVGVRGCRRGARGREDRARPRRLEWLPFGCVRAVQHSDAGRLTVATVATALARAV